MKGLDEQVEEVVDGLSDEDLLYIMEEYLQKKVMYDYDEIRTEKRPFGTSNVFGDLCDLLDVTFTVNRECQTENIGSYFPDRVFEKLSGFFSGHEVDVSLSLDGRGEKIRKERVMELIDLYIDKMEFEDVDIEDDLEGLKQYIDKHVGGGL